MSEEDLSLNLAPGAHPQPGDIADARDWFPGEHTYDTIFASLSALLVSGIYLIGWTAAHGNAVPALFSLWSVVLFAGLVLLAIWQSYPSADRFWRSCGLVAR